MEEKIITAALPHDEGKTFRIRVFPALQAEEWAWRALLAIFGSQAALPKDVAEAAQTSSMAALAGIGLQGLSGVSWEVVKPLLGELLRQAAIIPSPDNPQAVVPLHEGNVNAHIKNGATIAWLRMEVFALCVNFSTGGEALDFHNVFGPARKDSPSMQTPAA